MTLWTLPQVLGVGLIMMQGCAMSEPMPGLIRQLIIKPTPEIELEAGRLPAAYLSHLQQGEPDTHLQYGHPMALGAHVLLLEPALEPAAAQALATRLSARSDVEYAEPDRAIRLP